MCNKGNTVGIEITLMNEAHIAAIAEIEKMCFSHPRSENSLKNELFREESFYVAAACGETLAGYGGMDIVVDEAYISDIAVHPDYRRMGVASAIMNALINHCTEKNLAFITLEVRKSNTPAIRLYEKLGFESVGTRRGFYTDPKEDALLMTLYFDKNRDQSA